MWSSGMADAPLRSAFRRPFAEQVAAWRLRLAELIPTVRWDDIAGPAHDRGFMVAGAVKADLLADLAAAVDRAIIEGTGFEAFKRDFREIVARRGWHGWTGEGTVAGEEWRMRTIYRTNLRTTYMAGRRAQLVAGNFTYWVYKHSGARHPRLDHLSWDGLALPPDHAFWDVAFPPNGWGCGCEVYGARTPAGVRRLGGDPDKRLPDGWDRADPRTGLPRGIQRGWAHAPGAGVTADILAAVRDKALIAPAPLGEELMAWVRAGIARVRARPAAADGPSLDEVLGLMAVLRNVETERLVQAAATEVPGLSPGQRAAVNAYTQPFLHGALNARLRDVAHGTPRRATDEIRALDAWAAILAEAVARLTTHAGVVLRGIDASEDLIARFAALRTGQAVRFAGFSSASTTRPFAGEVQLRITSRTGRDVGSLAMLPEEAEVLFAPGTVFRVIATGHRHTPDGPVLMLDLEEIAPNMAPPDTVLLAEEAGPDAQTAVSV